MDVLTGKVLAKVPAIPPERIEISSGGDIAMFKTTNMFKGPFHIDSYTFIIPLFEIPPLRIDKKVQLVDAGSLIPINPGQSLGATIETEVKGYINLFIDRAFLQNICFSAFGKKEIHFKNESIIFESDIQNLIRSYAEECKYKQPGSELIIQALNTQIAVCLIRQSKSDVIQFINNYRYSERDYIQKVIAFLRTQYNKDFSFKDVAKIANFSPYYFIRVFKEATGKTPHEYLLDIKIEKAQELLRLKKYNITEICFLCGFNNISHFTTVFRKKVGVTPSHYRKIIYN